MQIRHDGSDLHPRAACRAMSAKSSLDGGYRPRACSHRCQCPSRCGQQGGQSTLTRVRRALSVPVRCKPDCRSKTPTANLNPDQIQSRHWAGSQLEYSDAVHRVLVLVLDLAHVRAPRLSRAHQRPVVDHPVDTQTNHCRRHVGLHHCRIGHPRRHRTRGSDPLTPPPPASGR